MIKSTMSMKNNIVTFVLITIVVFVSCFSSAAQDIIHTKDGRAIKSKVLEISDETVSYKMFDNLEGPVFKMTSNLIERIDFENGTHYSFVQEGKSHDLSADASLTTLTAPGNNALLVFEDQIGTFDEKDEYLVEYIKELTSWNLVSSKGNADFIIYVTGYSKRTARSFSSDTYFMTAEIQRPDGTVIWKGKEVSAYANLYNGFRAVRAVSKELVEEVLITDLEKEKRKAKTI